MDRGRSTWRPDRAAAGRLPPSRVRPPQFQHELANWDGLWYRELANKGYPSHVSYAQTTLGFFPLFPLAIWPVEHVSCCSRTNHLILSRDRRRSPDLRRRRPGRHDPRAPPGRGLVGPRHRAPGDDPVHRLPRLGRVLDGLLRGPAAAAGAGCIYALERRRWLLGRLPGRASAPRVQPVGLVLAPVCLISAACELRRSRLAQHCAPHGAASLAPAAVGHRHGRVLLFPVARGPATRWPPTSPSTTAGAKRPTRCRSGT